MITMSSVQHGDDDRLSSMMCRARGEYLEMPGLRLTVPQAARLWALDPVMSAQVLDDLARTGFLVRARDGAYLRPSAA